MRETVTVTVGILYIERTIVTRKFVQFSPRCRKQLIGKLRCVCDVTRLCYPNRLVIYDSACDFRITDECQAGGPVELSR